MCNILVSITTEGIVVWCIPTITYSSVCNLVAMAICKTRVWMQDGSIRWFYSIPLTKGFKQVVLIGTFKENIWSC